MSDCGEVDSDAEVMRDDDLAGRLIGDPHARDGLGRGRVLREV